MATKRPLVLVHGAWGGAWIWRRVLGPLRAAGHEVHAVTLSGDGDRAHLRRRDIGLADHVTDVLALIDNEELQDFVIVGHSYGGMVITGAADRLLGRPGGGGLARLAYVDAMVPLPGESWSSQHTPDVIIEREAVAAAHDNTLPPPDPQAFGIDGADRDWLLRRQVPHPFGMYRQVLDFDAARWAAVPRLFVDCNRPALPTIAAMRLRVREQPDWQVREIPTGHCPMVSAPAALAAMLLEFAAA